VATILTRDFRSRYVASSTSDPTTHKRLVFLTNQFALPALSIADLYRCRWQVELFFKWIKQHLRIKAFFGTSENAVKDTNLDRHLGRCPRQEAAEPAAVAL
jgi:IS4 transposase